TPQSIDEYIDMFITYKLKVADAEAAGIDTTAAFHKEFKGYCDELAAPYLRDSLTAERLVNEAYDRMKRRVAVSQIMLPIGNTREEKEANRARLDSIRTAILNGADFGEMAVKYSSDRNAMFNKGYYGFIAPNMYPYPFEAGAYSTPVGEISEVIEDAPYGFHIIRVEDEKPDEGRVHARHILKLTRNLSPEEAEIKKQQIDSIYTALKNGADFAEMAATQSDDAGSARRGGDLGNFGIGRMVPEFEKAAFSLNPGEISEPFKTTYGWHIVQTIERLPIETLEEARPAIQAVIARDERSRLPEIEKVNQLKKKYHAAIVPDGMNKAVAAIKSADTPAAGLELLAASDIVVAGINGRDITAEEVMKTIGENTRATTPDAVATFEDAAADYLSNQTVEYFKQHIGDENSTYRNLVNEYRDGILLFEISNRNIWDKSNKDKEGLEAFFNAHKDNYKWAAPKYKGYVIFATTDSVATAAKQYLADNKVGEDSLSTTLRKQFGRNIKVEKVIAGQGENAILDNVAFGGEKPDPVGRWIEWFGYNGRVIPAPEEAADVRGAVTEDYQKQLEQEWVSDLHKKYKVKVNKKVVNNLKKNKK
ncbi:MAG: peptidyl-prolyl cis-trans isomerase, partial [Duncaniella sp.]|nr:peptidyl-prolyl cis-trans isomerase [Duncaniella sp.]